MRIIGRAEPVHLHGRALGFSLSFLLHRTGEVFYLLFTHAGLGLLSRSFSSKLRSEEALLFL